MPEFFDNVVTLKAIDGTARIPKVPDDVADVKVPVDPAQNSKPLAVGKNYVILVCVDDDWKEVQEYLFYRINTHKTYKNRYQGLSIEDYQIQIRTILMKMVKLNYLAPYIVVDSGTGEKIAKICVVQNDFPSNKLIMEQIDLFLHSSPEEIENKHFILTDAEGKQYLSETPGVKGGHQGLGIYGRMDCPSAKKFLEKGKYAQQRVFFQDEETAVAAGYRPCGVCSKAAFKKWKEEHDAL